MRNVPRDYPVLLQNRGYRIEWQYHFRCGTPPLAAEIGIPLLRSSELKRLIHRRLKITGLRLTNINRKLWPYNTILFKLFSFLQLIYGSVTCIFFYNHDFSRKTANINMRKTYTTSSNFSCVHSS